MLVKCCDCDFTGGQPRLNSVLSMTKQTRYFSGKKIKLFFICPPRFRTSPADSVRVPSTHRHPPTSCIAPFKLSHRPPLDTQRSPIRRRVPPNHGQPPFSKAARRIRRKRRPAQDLARPQRTIRNRKRKFAFACQEAHQGWANYYQAHRYSLAGSYP